ncbi:hypothetical protein Clacol_005050 [Clathrus columnatus]|uniref:Laccase n=1 Tax=Clathrus columnatus TaxID=1419009 RepID=A0AAV5AAV4_9AGAM|nr:hypothetical protein Clacol_005050 [Clathrus columnatus]
MFPLLLFYIPLVGAATVEHWWNITYVDANPDGLFERRVIGVNGTWPPPPLEITSNDTLIVHAFNGIDKPTSLHHHGMAFNATGWGDGAVGVTQCGIPPNESFTYVLPVEQWNQWGSYWVHAHSMGQYVDGLRAPYIIHNENAGGEVYSAKYDAEFTVVIVLINQFLSQANPGGAEPIPDSGLIYFTQNGTYLPPIPSSSPPNPNVGFNENATLPFESGKTYRLRIINTSAFSAFFFWIDGHDMTLIEVDGTDIEEFPISLVSIAVAQRYSVLVTARNDTGSDVRNWVMHANME